MSTDKSLYIAEEGGKRLDVFLSEQTEEFTRSRLKKLIEEGSVQVDGNVVQKCGYIVKAGQGILVEVPTPISMEARPENIPLDILYQDDDLAVINKPKGMVVHAGSGNVDGTLVNALLYALDNLSGIGGVLRPGIVHRIDKDTTGLLVVAKNDRAHYSLATQIAEKRCRRTYYALLEGNVKEEKGTIWTDIARHKSERKEMAVVPFGEGKTAITDYECVCHFGNDFTLCKFNLQTGRTHQIRVHAKHMGHPIVGDPVYGYKKQKLSVADGQLLHAHTLSFTHPRTGKKMTFSAPLPPTFAEIINKLAKKYAVEVTI